MSPDTCVRVYKVKKGRVGGKSVTARRNSTCKGWWKGDSGVQGAGAEFNGTSSPPPVQDIVPPHPLCPDPCKDLDGGVWSQHLAPPPGGALPVSLPSLPTLSAKPSPPLLAVWQNNHPQSPCTRPQGRPGIRDGQSQDPICLARRVVPGLACGPRPSLDSHPPGQRAAQ